MGLVVLLGVYNLEILVSTANSSSSGWGGLGVVGLGEGK